MRDRERERESEIDRESLCVCVFVYARSRERKTERDRESVSERSAAHTNHVTYMNESGRTNECAIQGGGDPQDAFSCRSFFAKEPLIIGLFYGKRPIKIRHPMGLRHPVYVSACAREDMYV